MQAHDGIVPDPPGCATCARGLESEAAHGTLAGMMPGAVMATILALLAAYLQRGLTPFSIPISYLHDQRPGGWGYLATLAGLFAVVAIGAWQSARRRQWIACAALALCAGLLIVLACNPDGTRVHEPAAMFLGMASLAWMAARAGTSRLALPAPWLGLVGVLHLATGRDEPVAIGEALLLAGCLSASFGEVEVELRLPAVPAQVDRSIGWFARLLEESFRLVAPLQRMHGLSWGLFMLLVIHLSGALRGSTLAPVAVLASGWAVGWLLTRWDAGALIGGILRLGAPVVVLRLLVDLPHDQAAWLNMLLVLVSGGLVLGALWTSMNE